jgi:hypothetical protein
MKEALCIAIVDSQPIFVEFQNAVCIHQSRYYDLSTHIKATGEKLEKLKDFVYFIYHRLSTTLGSRY